jgi:hypothetical protein
LNGPVRTFDPQSVGEERRWSAAGNHQATDLGNLEMPIDTRLVTMSFPAETVDECS